MSEKISLDSSDREGIFIAFELFWQIGYLANSIRFTPQI